MDKKKPKYWATYLQMHGTDYMQSRTYEPVYRTQVIILSGPASGAHSASSSCNLAWWSRAQSSPTNRSTWRWHGEDPIAEYLDGDQRQRVARRTIYSALVGVAGHENKKTIPASWPRVQRPDMMMLTVPLAAAEYKSYTTLTENGKVKTPYRLLDRFKRAAMKRHSIDIS